MTVEDVASRDAVLDIIHRYVWGYDEQNLTELRSIFAEDIVWTVTIAGDEFSERHTGRADVLRWIGDSMGVQSEQRRHAVIGPRVLLDGESHANVLLTMLLFSTGVSSPTLAAAGFYRVELRMGQEGWRITRILSGFDAPARVLT
jgi:hypothetical protein